MRVPGSPLRYRDQLERCAPLLALTETRPIRVGPYFPLLCGWVQGYAVAYLRSSPWDGTLPEEGSWRGETMQLELSFLLVTRWRLLHARIRIVGKHAFVRMMLWLLHSIVLTFRVVEQLVHWWSAVLCELVKTWKLM